MRHLRLTLMIVAVALVAPAQADEFVMHGRVSYDTGGGLIRGTEDGDWSQATVNTLILPGDMIWADEGSMMEIELPGGTFVRLADETRMELEALDPHGVARAWNGSFYIQRVSRARGEFAIITPACTVEVEKDAAVRVDVLADGATTVTVRWGRAVVKVDDSDLVMVNSGQRLWVDPGYTPSYPVRFDRDQDDAFDRWNRERAEWLANRGAGPQVPTPIYEEVIGASDLDNYGEWIVVDSQPAWRPTVVVDYVPYRHGHWSYMPTMGHVWVGYYPFSYTTSHYGRWHYSSPYGWVWQYDPVWSPAWAATLRCGDYFMWTPIGFDYRPIYTTGWTYFSYGDLRFSYFATSCVPASYLYHDYGYVQAIDPLLFTLDYIYRSNPQVWEIHRDGRHGYQQRIPYSRRGDLQVATYRPDRAIRGVVARDGQRSAGDRVVRLEGRSGRTDFVRANLRANGARTSLETNDRRARMRQVTVSREAPSYTRATTRNPENATRTHEDVRLARRTEATEPRGPRPERAQSGVLRERTTTRRDAEPERTRATARDAGYTERGRSVVRVDAGSRERTPVRTEATRRQVSRTEPTRTPSYSTRSTDSGAETRRRVVSTGTTSSARSRAETPVRRSAPTVVRGDTNTRGSEPAAQRERTPVRNESPRVYTRSESRNAEPAPTVRRESAPSRETRSYTAPAPSRRETPEPSVSRERSYTPAPTRERTATPAPAPTRERTAAPAPTGSAPEPTVRSAPAPAPSPSRGSTVSSETTRQRPTASPSRPSRSDASSTTRSSGSRGGRR